jgi:hypothetical protein
LVAKISSGKRHTKGAAAFVSGSRAHGTSVGKGRAAFCTPSVLDS